jgi:hypothetical protein
MAARTERVAVTRAERRVDPELFRRFWVALTRRYWSPAPHRRRQH